MNNLINQMAQMLNIDVKTVAQIYKTGLEQGLENSLIGKDKYDIIEEINSIIYSN